MQQEVPHPGPTPRQILDVLDIKAMKDRTDLFTDAILCDEPPVSIGGDGETIEHAYAIRTEPLVELTERSVLAADERNIGQRDLIEVERKSHVRMC